MWFTDCLIIKEKIATNDQPYYWEGNWFHGYNEVLRNPFEKFSLNCFLRFFSQHCRRKRVNVFGIIKQFFGKREKISLEQMINWRSRDVRFSFLCKYTWREVMFYVSTYVYLHFFLFKLSDEKKSNISGRSSQAIFV
jgi:hypothetical protein